MNIWFDIAHIPQFNFYRWLICKLADDGHDVYVTVLDRGKLAKIAMKEIGGRDNVKLEIVGKHRSTRFSAIFEANLIRNIQLLSWAGRKHFDIGFSNGYQLAFVGAIMGFPTYSFDDDPDTIDYRPKLWFNKETNYCLWRYDKKLSSKAHILPVLKEWAYLAPEYFSPDVSALDEYGLTPKSYIFAREVSVGTINYQGQSYGAVREIAGKLPAEMKVVLSLEKKETIGDYPTDWILLNEPIKDIHSLIYYSAALVSSGDSMAREAALLGIPSYYLGVRYDMPANFSTSQVAGLQNTHSISFDKWAASLGHESEKMIEEQKKLRKEISSRMMDINKYMLDIVNALE